MATRSSDSSSSSTDQRLVCELSPKGTTAFKWQSSTDAGGEYFSAWDKTAHASLVASKDKYFCTGPINPTKTSVSVRWYLKDSASNDADSGMTGSSVKE